MINFFSKIKKKNRIGPDFPYSQILIYLLGNKRHKLFNKIFKYFGENSDVRLSSFVIGCSKISIGDRVIIRANTMLFGESSSLDTSIEIEDDVLIGSGVHIYINNHKYLEDKPIISQGYFPDQKVIIKRGSWVGANSIILPGVVIGENSVVGAGSIVTKSIPPRSVFAGNPAKIIRKLD